VIACLLESSWHYQWVHHWLLGGLVASDTVMFNEFNLFCSMTHQYCTARCFAGAYTVFLARGQLNQGSICACCLERLLSKMTYNVSTGTLNATYSPHLLIALWARLVIMSDIIARRLLCTAYSPLLPSVEKDRQTFVDENSHFWMTCCRVGQ